MSWQQLFPTAKLYNLEISSSDHSPLLLQLSTTEVRQSCKRFKTETVWLNNPRCEEIVRTCWSECDAYDIMAKLERCSRALEVWGKEIKETFTSDIKKHSLQMKRFKRRTDREGLILYEEHSRKFFEALLQKEIYWRQRSKSLWLQAGNRNSKFFHQVASKRKKNNSITTLKDAQGKAVDWDNGLPDLIKQYYQDLFQTSNPLYQDVLNGIPRRVTSEQNAQLVKEVTDEEVLSALMQMHPEKAPGPDGLSAGFYQKFWNIVREDVLHFVRFFFSTGHIQPGINDTLLVLIPKKKCPENMNELRPIALCNVLYKLISKVLANRLKPLLPSLISLEQSAFIKGRLITDNILVSFEMLHYMKRRRTGQHGKMAIKLDMSKAYDRIEWAYLEGLLLQMGFSPIWVQWVLECVTSTEFTVVTSGREVKLDCPQRGLRQGDPISPYLFIICVEGLSTLLKDYEAKGLIHGCKVARTAPTVSHLLFADDIYIYADANIVEAEYVLQLLQTFQQASGQMVNFGKSDIFFTPNLSSVDKSRICDFLCIPEASSTTKYLGLPNQMKRNKHAIFGYIIDRVRRRISSWDGRLLSRAGKEVLLKAVIQALPVYTMSVFLLPVECCRKIQHYMSNYWWSNKPSSSGIHWLKWDTLCVNKHNGGMGFKDIRDMNLALLGKQVWRLLTQESTLMAQIFKAKYYPTTSVLQARLGSNPSYVWRSIYSAINIVQNGSRICIHSGQNTSILQDPWLPDPSNGLLTSEHPGLQNRQVVSLMNQSHTDWDMDIINDLCNNRDKQWISSVPILPSTKKDNWYWIYEAGGEYSVKTAYRVLRRSKEQQVEEAVRGFWISFWNSKIPPVVLNFIWRACKQILPTNLALKARRIAADNLCPLCKSAAETVPHALIDCSFAQICWEHLCQTSVSSEGRSFGAWLSHKLTIWQGEMAKKAMVLCWAIWKARNDLVWKNVVTTPASVTAFTHITLTQWTEAQNQLQPFAEQNRTISDELWTKPSFDVVKVNVDAAVFYETKVFGIGGIAHNHMGEVLGSFQRSQPGGVSVDVAEALALKEALSWIKNKEWRRVIVETDSLRVYAAIRSPLLIRSPFGMIIEACKNIHLPLSSIVINHVKRSANSVAHMLAHTSVTIPDCNLLWEHFPLLWLLLLKQIFYK